MRVTPRLAQNNRVSAKFPVKLGTNPKKNRQSNQGFRTAQTFIQNQLIRRLKIKVAWIVEAGNVDVEEEEIEVQIEVEAEILEMIIGEPKGELHGTKVEAQVKSQRRVQVIIVETVEVETIDTELSNRETVGE